MPRVRMLVSVAGLEGSWEAGEVVDMTVEQAAVWADGERGELVRSEPVESPERPVVGGRRRVPRMETPEGR